MNGAIELPRRQRQQRINARNSQTAGRAMRDTNRAATPIAAGKALQAILAPLALLDAQAACARNDVRHLQRHDFGDPQSGTIGGAQRGLYFGPGAASSRPCDLLRLKITGILRGSRTNVRCRAISGGRASREEETQRRNRAMMLAHQRRLRLMQLEKAKILRRGRYPARGRERL